MTDKFTGGVCGVRAVVAAAIVAASLVAVSASASAQFAGRTFGPSPSPLLFPPPPPAPPPPRIEVPVVPRMDAPVLPRASVTPRPSYSDRIERCLDEAAARGVGAADRAGYSTACAHRE